MVTPAVVATDRLENAATVVLEDGGEVLGATVDVEVLGIRG